MFSNKRQKGQACDQAFRITVLNGVPTFRDKLERKLEDCVALHSSAVP
jgi:hypothetical protein